MISATEIARELHKARKNGKGWKACCPAHDDNEPSLDIDDGPDGKPLVICRAGCAQEAVIAALKDRGLWPNGAAGTGQGNPKRRIVATYDYHDHDGQLAYQVVRFAPKEFRQRRRARPDDPPGKVRDGWCWSVKGVRQMPYRLPEIVEAMALDQTLFIVEGEKDADRLWSLGVPATCSAMGAGKWPAVLNGHFRGAHVVILPDNDDAGQEHARLVGRSLKSVAATVKVVTLPSLPPKGDVSNWLDAGGTDEGLYALAAATEPWPNGYAEEAAPEHFGVRIEDFAAYMPAHTYIFKPSGEMWPASSVNSRIPPVAIGRDEGGKAKTISAAAWLDRNAAVEQMTWAPGEPPLVADRLISDGGWIKRPGCTVFNLYRPPTIAARTGCVDPWLDHAYRLLGDDAGHVIRWLAHRIQRPHEKINHALVLGGAQGIGKDTLLEPVKQAVGPWNFSEVSPQHMLGRFNGFVRSVILRVSEARDLGDVDRFAFYDHLKAYTAAPPDVLRCDEKHLREYAVLNVMGVIITSNHKTDGIYLPDDDRRHFVAWSDLTKDDFPPDYWTGLYRWFGQGGNELVAGYLASLDISGFDPKAPPAKTDAFWEIVHSSRAPESSGLADALDEAGWPDAVTLRSLALKAPPEFGDWLRDRRNARIVPHRLEECGYVAVVNPSAKDGHWKIAGNRQMVYAKRDLAPQARIEAALRLCGR